MEKARYIHQVTIVRESNGEHYRLSDFPRAIFALKQILSIQDNGDFFKFSMSGKLSDVERELIRISLRKTDQNLSQRLGFLEKRKRGATLNQTTIFIRERR